MASISGKGDKGHHTFILYVTEKSTSVADNTSNVSFSFDISSPSGGWRWEGWGSNISYEININGSKYEGTIPNFAGNTTVTLKSGSLNIGHNSDGTKSISYSFTVTDGANQRYTSGNASASGTMTLTTVPRASSISSVSGTTIGGSMTVNISRAASTFTHQLWYKVGNSAWYDLGSGIGTSKAFTIDIATASQFPNATSGTLQLCLRTFNSGTVIGNDYYKDVTVSVPSYTPTISNIKLTGNNLFSGEYVQGKSTVTVEITAPTSTLHGATIKSYSSTVDGKTYSGSKFTSISLSSGSKSVSVTITDTRGKTATLTSSAITVRAYSNPTITEFTLVRQSDETTVIATVKGSVASVNNKNAKNVQITLNGVTQTITSSSYTISGTTTFTGVPTDNTLTSVAKIADSFTQATREFVLPTVDVTLDFHHSGTGIAMGKVAEFEGTFDCDWRLRLQGDYVSDYEIYRGTSDGWIVKKYKSGEIEAYKSVSVNTTVSTVYGNGYYNGSTLSVNLPTDFVNNAFPIINLNAQSTQAQILSANIAAYNQAERKISYYITSFGKQATAYQVWLHFRVVGRWK